MRHSVLLGFVLFFLGLAGHATAQTGLEISTTLDEVRPPGRILAMEPGTTRYFGDRRGWGGIDLRPGRYEILLEALSPDSGNIRFPAVSVGSSGSRFVIGSGLSLKSAEEDVPAPEWFVTDPSGETLLWGMKSGWGTVPLPPGMYRVMVPGLLDRVLSRPTRVSPGAPTALSLRDVGVGHVRFEMPPANTSFLFGQDEMRPILEVGDERYDLSQNRTGNHLDLWLQPGSVVLERNAGGLVERLPIEIEAGTSTRLDFDLDRFLQDRWLSAFTVPQEIDSSDVQLRVRARSGEGALALQPDSRARRVYVVPGAAEVEMVAPDGRAQSLALPPQAVTGLPDLPRADDAANAPVSLVLESPAEGLEVPPDTENVTIVGQARAEGKAGATNIVLVLDVSASTADPAGADLDGDGRVDSILDAEKAAVSLFLDALAEAEDAAPGTAFAVSVVGFGDTPLPMTPLLPLTGEATLARLQTAVEALTQGSAGGSTFYGRAIDTALRQLDAEAGPGPRVILLITDGKPSQVVPAIDAAARAGAAGTMLNTVGLGPDFRGTTPRAVSYPPVPESGPAILATMAAFGHAGSRIWALPRPADIVDIVPTLPVLRPQDARIASVAIRNETLGIDAASVDLRAGGHFSADLPVTFATREVGLSNTLRIVATAETDAQAELSRRVTASGFVPPEPEIDPEALAALVAERAGLRNRLAEAEAALQAERGGRAELVAERDALRAEHQTAQEAERRVDALAIEVTRLREEVASVSSEKEALAQDAAALRAAVQTARTEGSNATRLAESLRGNLAQCEAARRDCTAEFDAALNRFLNVRDVPEGLVLEVSSDVLFDFGDASIREDAAEALQLATRFLENHEKSDLVIEGHTDGLGSEEFNRSLSLERARAVATWFTDEAGLARDRLQILGLGESQPISAETLGDGSDWPEGRQRNRRVEIRILK